MSFDDEIKKGMNFKNYLLAFHRENYKDTQITEEIFYNEFFVNDNERYGKTIKSINKFILDMNKEFLILKGSAGSGKSVFIDSLFSSSSPAKSNKFDNANVEVLDFAELCEVGLIENLKNQLIDAYATFKDGTINQINSIQKSIQTAYLDTNDVYYGNLYQSLITLFISPSSSNSFNWGDEGMLKDYIKFAINKLINKTKASESEIDLFNKIVFFLITLWIIFKALKYKDSNKKLIIIYDNIEALRAEQKNIICDIINKIPNLFYSANLKSIYNIKHIFVCRTTTRVQILTDHFNSRPKAVELNLPNFYFAPNAISKKYDYLNRKNLNNKIDILGVTDILCRLFLDNDDPNKLKEGYISRRYLPFFGNNFRNVISYAVDTLLDDNNKIKTKISSLLNYSNFCVNESINGARAILVKSTFDMLGEDNNLAEMGIAKLDGHDSYSKTRIILNYIYWHNFIKSSNEDGVELKKIYNDLKYFFNDNHTDFGLAIRNISIYNKIPVTAWNNLIDFTNLAIESKDFDVDNAYKSDLKVTINSTAKLFIEIYSMHFEFFNSRNENEHNALFLIQELSELQATLKDISTAIEHFINGMLNDAYKICKLYSPISTKTICNLESRSIYNCSLFTRLRQVIWCIADNIDYVDRYRLYISHEYNSDWEKAKSFNIACLDFMLSIANNYNKISLDNKEFAEYYNKSFSPIKNKDTNNSFRLAYRCHYNEIVKPEETISTIKKHLHAIKSINSQTEWKNYMKTCILDTDSNLKLRLFDLIKQKK